MYLIFIVLLRQLAPPSPASREPPTAATVAVGMVDELAHTIDLGLIHLHGGSSGSNCGESSLTW
jgi:hypothetical protein